RGIDVLHVDRGGLKKASAPVRRSWVRRTSKAAKAVSFRTGYSKRSRFGYVCRLLVPRAIR
ncbi:MAG: hypothetical protein QOF75_1723, partial [Gaiellaceae bacterium]|nr:hypothetical protein [Gaiellaceae bacterium]